jgi:hypothetical protein
VEDSSSVKEDLLGDTVTSANATESEPSSVKDRNIPAGQDGEKKSKDEKNNIIIGNSNKFDKGLANSTLSSQLLDKITKSHNFSHIEVDVNGTNTTEKKELKVPDSITNTNDERKFAGEEARDGDTINKKSDLKNATSVVDISKDEPVKDKNNTKGTETVLKGPNATTSTDGKLSSSIKITNSTDMQNATTANDNPSRVVVNGTTTTETDNPVMTHKIGTSVDLKESRTVRKTVNNTKEENVVVSTEEHSNVEKVNSNATESLVKENETAKKNIDTANNTKMEHVNDTDLMSHGVQDKGSNMTVIGESWNNGKTSTDHNITLQSNYNTDKNTTNSTLGK